MLTRCPSCQASVLDDDAEVCPFCDSPMDPAKAKAWAKDHPTATKPTEKPAAQRPTSPSPEAKEKSAATASSGKPTARKSSKGSSGSRSGKSPEDPFAVDPSTMAGVIALSTKRTQNRPQKIVCPMCDTVGYAPLSASGKDVRCANPKCMVPVFTAPDFATPKRELVEESTSKGTVLTIVGVAIVVLGGGFAYWWLNFRAPEAGSTDSNIVTPMPTAPTAKDPQKDPQEDVPEVAAAPATAAEVREQAFRRWPEVLETVADIQRRPVRLRLAAESYAIAGNLEQARAYLEEIGSGDRDRFYRIGPLAEIAWAQLEAGDEAGAKATYDDMAGLWGAIPNQGFEPGRAATVWTAAAGRFGDAGAARDLAGKRRDDPAGDRLLASMESAAALSAFDLDANHPWRPVLPWSAPKPVAVAMNLVRHGQLDAARAWGEGAAAPPAQAETLAAWAQGQIAQGTNGAETVRQAVAALDPAVKLYVLSRAALRAIAGDDSATAESLFADIESTAAGIAASDPLSATTAGQLHAIALTDTAPEQLRGAAFAEAAHVAARLEKTEPATSFVWRAVDHLRASAPPVADVVAREREFETAGLDGIRGTLKTELDLSDPAVQEAATNYRRKLPGYRRAADAGLVARARILARGIGWGLGESILAEIRTREETAEEGQSQKYLAGSAGGRIWAAYHEAGELESAAAIRAAGVGNRDVPLEAGMELVVWPLVESGKPTEAGQQLAGGTWSRVSDAERLGLAMRIVTRLAGEGKHAEISQFLTPINSDSHREELYRAWGARAAASHEGMAFLEQIGKTRMSITAVAAALRGLTAGLELLPEPVPTTEASGEASETTEE